MKLYTTHCTIGASSERLSLSYYLPSLQDFIVVKTGFKDYFNNRRS